MHSHDHDHGGCLRFHSVIARRRYTGSSATADSADCRFGNMAREGRGGEGEGRAGQGRAGQGRAGQGRGRAGQGRAGEGRGGEGGEGRGGEGRGGEGRGGDCPHVPQTRTFVTAEPSRPPAKRVTG